tara:strand:- start:5032 stop:5304 length:273 start_codon:yes stop_codon:yes gene_type:complete
VGILPCQILFPLVLRSFDDGKGLLRNPDVTGQFRIAAASLRLMILRQVFDYCRKELAIPISGQIAELLERPRRDITDVALRGRGNNDSWR